MLTDKCVNLEKILLEKEEIISKMKLVDQAKIHDKRNYVNHSSSAPEDYHTQILKQELNRYKQDNINLQATIEFLQGENKSIAEELEQTKISYQSCIHCYPTLLSKGVNNYNTWQVVKNSKKPCSSSKYSSKDHDDKVKSNDKYFNTRSETDANSRAPASNGYLKTGEPIHNHTNISIKTNQCRLRTYKTSRTDKHSKLTILADSHGRNLCNLLQQRTTDKVLSFIKPGARFNKVVEEVKEITEDLNKNDHLLVIAGTNNIETTSRAILLKDIQNLISNSQHTNLILASIPMRHDAPELDIKITQINSEIEKLAQNYEDNLTLLPLHLLPRHLYTNHGLHLNKKGKLKLSEMVTTILSKKRCDKVCPSRDVSYRASTRQHPLSIKEDDVSVVNPDMSSDGELISMIQSVTPLNDMRIGCSHTANQLESSPVSSLNALGGCFSCMDDSAMQMTGTVVHLERQQNDSLTLTSSPLDCFTGEGGLGSLENNVKNTNIFLD